MVSWKSSNFNPMFKYAGYDFLKCIGEGWPGSRMYFNNLIMILPVSNKTP